MTSDAISFWSAPHEKTVRLLDIYEERGTRMVDNGYTADSVTFSDFNTRIRLAAQGLFSVDRTDHKAQRAAERAVELRLDIAYSVVGVDRKATYRNIAMAIEATQTNGVWARSTGRYAAEVAAMDRKVTALAASIQWAVKRRDAQQLVQAA